MTIQIESEMLEEMFKSILESNRVYAKELKAKDAELQHLRDRLAKAGRVRTVVSKSVQRAAYQEGYEDGVHDTTHAASIERGIEKPARKNLQPEEKKND